MRILLYQWSNYLQYDIEWIFKEQGVNYKIFNWEFKDPDVDDEFERWFEQNIRASEYDALFSVNYFPLLSRCAQKNGLKYIAWSCDCPISSVNVEETLGNSINHVFCFDRIQAEGYARAGFNTVYHLPLGVNSARIKNIHITSREYEKYGAEISFVGRLYESQLQGIKTLLDEYTIGYITALMELQQNIYGYYFLDEMVSEEIIKRNAAYINKYPDKTMRFLKEALVYAMACEITRNERLILLALLGRRFDTRLYSFHTEDVLKGVKLFPPVEYETEMPLVFACSKINLNPVLRCIQSGVPLRAYDVMAAGGFLLSGYQTELVEQFVPDEEMVVYESLEDAVEKAGFYLNHEEQRKNIAMRGKKKTLEEHDMKDCLNTMFQMANV